MPEASLTPEIDTLLSPEHRMELHAAKQALERPGFGIQVVNYLGKPLEMGIERLPATWQNQVVGISRDALEKATEAAIHTLDKRHARPSSDLFHRGLVTLSGSLGGAFGLPALAVELPISTTIMLRSIADIARAEGENLAAAETRLSCVEVFALGGPSPDDDAAESSYFLVRAALAKAVSEAAEFLAVRGSTPAMVRFFTEVATRFGIQVTEKAAAQAMPVLGAAGGAIINNLFIDHFQNMARGHFTVRRLERVYSPEVIQAAYRDL